MAGPQRPPSSGSLKGTHLSLCCVSSTVGLGMTAEDVRLGWRQGGSPSLPWVLLRAPTAPLGPVL